MKRKIHKLLSSVKPGLFALTLTLFSGTVYSQNTYTLNYTGNVQTMNLSAGTYTIETWGADGGDNLGNGSTTFLQNGGKGGYSVGTYTLANPTTIYIGVGGKGGNSTSALNTTITGGYNGGGYGSGNTTAGKSSGAGGGGATHVATTTGLLSGLVGNQPSVRIVAGGGGGAGESNYVNTNVQYNSNGGNGGGTSGLQDIASGYQGRMGQGGTQIAGGGGGDNGAAIAGVPLQGIFGEGGYNPTAGVNTSVGGSGAGGGGGGWYGGGAGWVATGTSFQSGSGGGGSGYIGGVTNGTTVAFGQTGFVTKPIVTADGLVIIRELCSISLTSSGTNSLQPSICAGQSVTLTTDGISNYSWSTGNTTNSTIVVSPAATTVYTLSATSPSNCTASKSITVTVSSALPVLTITNTPNSICLGKTATLTAGGALTYTWTGGVQNGQTFTPNATSGYTVTGQNGCGQSTASTTITIAPLAVAVASSSNNICSGSPAILTATSAVNGFTWMPGNLTGTNVTVAPLVNTVYTLTASDGTCNGVATLTLNTKPVPVLQIVASATNVCEGSAVTLTVTGANTYTWSALSSNANIITVNPTSATSYIVSGTNGVNCDASTSQIIVTKPNPVVNISTNKSLVCEGGASTLTASGGSSSYVWVNGPSTNTNVVNPTVSSTYTVTGTAGNGCTTDKTITINVLAVSVIVNPTATTVCEGSSTVLNASGATSYTWVGFGNFSSATVSPTITTTYSVNANTTSQGLTCPSFTTVVVSVNALPTVSVAATKTTVCRKDANVIITASGANSYVWASAQTSNTISVHPQTTTNYAVTGTDVNGCQDIATIQIVVNACTGIEEFKTEKAISVYPNPTNGEFTIVFESDIVLKVMNELGQEVDRIILNKHNDYKASVSNLTNGIYFIVGQNETERVSQKVIVNK